VRSDTEEIDLAREQIRHDGCGGHLNHHANLKFVVERMAFSAQLVPAFIDDLQAAPDLIEAGDHREHHLDVRPDARSQDGAQLGFENLEIFETKTNRSPAKKRIEFVAPFNAVRNLVAPEVKGAYD